MQCMPLTERHAIWIINVAIFDSSQILDTRLTSTRLQLPAIYVSTKQHVTSSCFWHTDTWRTMGHDSRRNEICSQTNCARRVLCNRNVTAAAVVRVGCDIYIQLYSPECTLAENININNNKHLMAEHHHHHHFICPIIQQYAHLREYDSRRAGQQGPIRTLPAALKRSIKTVTGCIFYHTNKNITNEKN